MTMVKEPDENTSTEYLCNGGCCQRFYIPYKPEYVKQVNETLKNDPTKDLGESEWNIIAPMLIHLEDYDGAGAWYTCKNLDTETNLCKIYENRPTMCRGYPYGDACTYCGSTCGTEKKVRESGGISAEEVASRVGNDG